ncbi:MAG TPA: methyltransferase domain-containing protein [Nocardioidaceae bacterium]
MSAARVDTEAIWIPEAWDVTIDVLFEEQRIFAIAPARHRVRPDGLRAVPWPPALHPHLQGSTTVVLRGHLDGRVLHREEVAFGDSAARVRLVDAEGYPLALNKWGKLQRPFEAGSPESGLLLADLQELLGTMNDELGRPAFIAYGTLLGAVRSGSFIGHDTDADIAYYSRHEHPADILRESFLVQRRLSQLGWRTQRRGGGFVQVWRSDEAAEERKIDIFAAYHLNGWFAVNKWVRAKLPRESILPLGEVTLEGVDLPAPHDPAALLAATYGPGWRVPDPSFKFHVPPSMGRRAEGWLGWSRLDNRRWRVAVASHLDRGDPSDFARDVETRLAPRSSVLEVGSGAGADALWLAAQGHSVAAIDYLPGAVERNNERAAELGVDARFELVSLYDLRQVMVRAAHLAAEPRPAIYARSVLEALHPVGRHNLWLLARTALGGGGSLFLEFRTDRSGDGSPQRARKPWLRTFSPELVAAEIVARGGTVTQQELVTDERGQHCRMVATWGTPTRRGDMAHTGDGHEGSSVDAEHEHRDYWEGFYASEASRKVPTEPSPFARWVAQREGAPAPMVDIGTGTGRDALWFARQGFDVVGLDYAHSAVALATSHAEGEGLSARFQQLNLYHDDEMTETGAKLAAELRPELLYARFFVHALEDDGRENLWRLAGLLLRDGGRAYLEFRVTETNHVFGEHFRHFVSPDVVIGEIEAHGGRVEHHEVGTGLAVYKDEDPLVCRIVATW